MTLVVQDLRKSFATGFSVGPFSLKADSGVFHLQGPNGCGKTTLLRCMTGQLRASSGKVEVCGHDVLNHVPSRKHIALVPAALELPEFLTVDEAWKTLAALRRCPSWSGVELRERLGISGDLLLAHASAGQRRRAELIAGLAGDPAVLLVDEPFANLDVQSVPIVAEILEGYAKKGVVLVTAHGEIPLDSARISV